MTKQRIVLGNWKMNTTRAEAIGIAGQLANEAAGDVRVGIAPPFPWLEPVQTALADSAVWLGAQTCSASTNGAFTGEVSASMLAELCSFVLVGHSERRAMFGETDVVVRAKLERVLESGLRPVLCVGESLGQRRAGSADAVVIGQVGAALSGIEASRLADLVIAYEPVWAIGTGVTASPDDAAAMGETIYQALTEFDLGDVPVLYGGSVSAANAASLIAAGNVDGFLVGGASLKPGDFMPIAAAARN